MPVDWSKYPTFWPEIRAAALERSGNRCDLCGVENRRFIVREKGAGFRYVDSGVGDYGSELEAAYLDGEKPIQVVLTVAHLDHTPANCDPDNLRALCQRCHLRLDAALHGRNAARTRAVKAYEAKRASMGDMFREGPKSLKTPVKPTPEESREARRNYEALKRDVDELGDFPTDKERGSWEW